MDCRRTFIIVTVTITLSLVIVVIMIMIMIIVVIVVGLALIMSLVNLSGRAIAFAVFFKRLDEQDWMRDSTVDSLPSPPWQ